MVEPNKEIYLIGWDIIYSIKNIISKESWKKNKERIIFYVLSDSFNMDINNLEQIASWRIKSYIYAGINHLS